MGIDELAKEPNAKIELRNQLVDELFENPGYSHGVFGSFNGTSHFLQETKGQEGVIHDFEPRKTDEEGYYWSEKEYSELFHDRGGIEFQARVHGERVHSGFKFCLSFNDRQGDSRHGSHTDYILIIPTSEVQRVVPLIKGDLSVLVDVFQRAFSNHDRSQGKLSVDNLPNNSIINY